MIRRPNAKRSVILDQTASSLFKCERKPGVSTWKVSSVSAFTVLSRAVADDTQVKKSVPQDSGSSEVTGSDHVVGDQNEDDVVSEPLNTLTATGWGQGDSAALSWLNMMIVFLNGLIEQLLAWIEEYVDLSARNRGVGLMLRK